MNKGSVESNLTTNYWQIFQQSSMFMEISSVVPPSTDFQSLMSPPPQIKEPDTTDYDISCEPDKEDKENVSPSVTTCSTTTPLKPPIASRSHPWCSSERTPLGDISHHFCPKQKKAEVTFKILIS